MFCTRCGIALADDSSFCPHCGAKVEEEAGGTSAERTEFIPPVEREGFPVPPPAAETQVIDFKPAAETQVIGYEPPVDMTHAFDPEPVVQASPAHTAEIPVIETPSAPASYNAVPKPVVGSRHRQPAPKKGKGGLIAGIVIAVVVIIIAAAAAAFFLTAPQKVTVSFETEGGSTVSAMTCEQGDKLTSPANPVKDGYSFDGWYADADYSLPVSFPYQPQTDVTLYAKWTKLEENTGNSAGQSSETYTDDDKAVASLRGYLTTLKRANEKLRDAVDVFNKNYNKGTTNALKAQDACRETQAEIEDLLMDDSGQWKVSTYTIPETYSKVRSQLEKASDTLITRLTAYTSALEVAADMGDAASADVTSAIGDYLKSGHNAYTEYKDLVAKAGKTLGSN